MTRDQLVELVLLMAAALLVLGLVLFMWFATSGLAQSAAYVLTPAGIALPDPRVTPGEVAITDLHEICTRKWGLDRRFVTESMKRRVCALYGLQCPLHSSKTLTSPTEPRAVTIMDPRIGGVESMAAGAMSPTGLFGERPYATKYVLPMGNSLKVGRVDTRGRPTEMIEFKTVWYGTDNHFVDQDMGASLAKAAISAAHHSVPDPNPASADHFLLNSSFKRDGNSQDSDRAISRVSAGPVTHCSGNSTICVHGIEIDHLIPRELGGADTIKNLWPQIWREAKMKDRVENALHQKVCAGELELPETQFRIAANWWALYQELFGPQ